MSKMVAQVREVIKPSTDGFNCLVHNDTWTNNLMFRGADAVKLLDLQIIRYARPAVDLVRLMACCTRAKFRHENTTELLKHYYEVIARRMKALGHDPDKVYPWDSLKSDYDECFVFGFVMAGFHLQVARFYKVYFM